jgi:outer membrane lipoprotein-sorting protein
MKNKLAPMRPAANRRRLVILSALVLAAGNPQATTADAPAPAARPAAKQMTVDDIGACMRRNAVDRGSLRRLDVTVTNRDGKTRSLKMKLYWTKVERDERMTLQVTAPPDVAGSSYLVRSGGAGDEVYVYLPALDRVQRVAGAEASRPLWGTDFTYAEIQQIQGLFQEGDTKRVEDTTVFGRPAFMLETDTDAERTGYDAVRSYVDQESCTLLKSELVGTDGKELKVLEADLRTLVEVDPWWLILGYVMRDTLRGSQTRLELSDVVLRESLPEKLFSPEEFYRTRP